MIGALLLGLIAGALGRAIVPNDAFEGMRGPESWLVSIVLGLVGAALGWAIFTAGLGIGDDDMFDLGGLLSALIGVVIVLLVANFVIRRTGGGHRGSPTARRV
ncbi:MAG TPA: GlsB/YeaQ/YmgE family stress response membrane protein [Solirubrobacterales bacterium]|nr:GlsB/YeaQ/YmgE family stress response membrane protein [Solirubrobacterales bacterium]